jgi:hypothetical protein
MPVRNTENAIEEFDAFDEYQLGFVDGVLFMQGIEAPTEDEFAGALRKLMEFRRQRLPPSGIN